MTTTTINTKTILYARCQEPGTLKLGFENPERTMNPASYAAYEFKTAEGLHKIASQYETVHRVGGREVAGIDYSIEDARQDMETWQAHVARMRQRGTFRIISPYGGPKTLENVTRRRAENEFGYASGGEEGYRLEEMIEGNWQPV